MKTSTEILPNACAHFEQIKTALGIESGSPDSGLADEFWSGLAAGIAPPRSASDPLTGVLLEEALVWRILSRRMLRELGASDLFQARTKGAASGTAAAHPAVEGLSKTYERLKRIMDELTPSIPNDTPPTATGLPMRMMKVLEETEGFLEHALGLKPGEKSAFSPRLRRNGDQRSGDAV